MKYIKRLKHRNTISTNQPR